MAQLGHGLVDEAEAVGPALGQLAAVGVHGQIAVEGDALPAVEVVLRLAEAAEPETFEPRDRVEGEPVGEERQVADANTAVVTSGGGTPSGVLLLQRDGA